MEAFEYTERDLTDLTISRFNSIEEANRLELLKKINRRNNSIKRTTWLEIYVRLQRLNPIIAKKTILKFLEDEAYFEYREELAELLKEYESISIPLVQPKKSNESKPKKEIVTPESMEQAKNEFVEGIQRLDPKVARQILNRLLNEENDNNQRELLTVLLNETEEKIKAKNATKPEPYKRRFL